MWSVGPVPISLTGIVYNVTDIHHEALVVRLQWCWRVMSVLSAMWRTFIMKCWWSDFNDFDMCWCQYCLQCDGQSPWNVGGQASMILTCVDVSIVCNAMDIHHEMVVVTLQWFLQSHLVSCTVPFFSNSNKLFLLINPIHKIHFVNLMST
jgi:hypothetical protein